MTEPVTFTISATIEWRDGGRLAVVCYSHSPRRGEHYRFEIAMGEAEREAFGAEIERQIESAMQFASDHFSRCLEASNR